MVWILNAAASVSYTHLNPPSIAPILHMQGVAKRFTLHHQNGIELSVLAQVDPVSYTHLDVYKRQTIYNDLI